MHGHTLFLLLALTPAHAQERGDHRYDVVPPETRKRFISRLELYLRHSKQNDADRLKTPYTTDTLCSICLGSKECEEDCSLSMDLDLTYLEELTTVSYRVLEIRRARYRPDEIEIVLERVERVKQHGIPAHLVKGSRIRKGGARPEILTFEQRVSPTSLVS